MNTELYLNNILSKKKEIFRSTEEGKVKMFTCGPSTYSRARIGNYRTFLKASIKDGLSRKKSPFTVSGYFFTKKADFCNRNPASKVRS